jgi:ParB family chromosome partitioning protein
LSQQQSQEQQQITYLSPDEILVPEERVTSVFDEEIERELEESIKQHGILQPLQIALVNNKYVLIDGLHRLRIAKKLGISKVPCIVKQMSEDQLLITNLIVNRQRGKSNPAQEAMVLKKLIDDYKYSINYAAEVLGMSRSTAEKYYQIATRLSRTCMEFLSDGVLSVGCAYYISFIDDVEKQNNVCTWAIQYGYTVEQCKSAVQSIIQPEAPTPYTVNIETGEIKPRPIPVYPCGKEVDPSKVVVVHIDAEVWPLIQRSFEQLCQEGFFYGEQTQQQQQQQQELATETETLTTEVSQPKQEQKQAKRDWFTELV